MLRTKRGKIGVFLIALGIIMFFIGVSMFSQKGITKLYSVIGQISFVLWLPIFISGVFLSIISFFKKK